MNITNITKRALSMIGLLPSFNTDLTDAQKTDGISFTTIALADFTATGKHSLGTKLTEVTVSLDDENYLVLDDINFATVKKIIRIRSDVRTVLSKVSLSAIGLDSLQSDSQYALTSEITYSDEGQIELFGSSRLSFATDMLQDDDEIIVYTSVGIEIPDDADDLLGIPSNWESYVILQCAINFADASYIELSDSTHARAEMLREQVYASVGKSSASIEDATETLNVKEVF